MSSATTGGSADELSQASAPTATVRLYLRASNLPKSLTGQRPDTLARVSLLPPRTGLPPPPMIGVDGDGDGGGAAEEGEEAAGETEVVAKSSNPKYAASFPLQYELGSQMLVFVDVFAVRSSSGSFMSASLGSIVSKRGMKLLGRAVYDIQDVLGTGDNVKARRLRNGGVVYAHVEQQSSDDASLSRSLSSAPSTNRRLNLRLRASSLVHTHSLQSRIAPTSTAKPDTYVEISRPSSSSSSASWVVVYRSPPVKESVSPVWDEAAIDLGPCPSAGPAALASQREMSALPLTIAVYKVKRKKCKEIGSCQTTVENLVEACRTMAKVTGHEGERTSSRSWEEEEEGRRESFELRPTARGGAGPPDEVTGLLSVVRASIAGAEEATMRSRRFLRPDADEEEEEAKERSAWSDDDADAVERHVEVAPSSHHPRPKFSDYVGADMLDIDFCVAIDFTSSNGDPRRPGTLHFSRDGMMNDYEEAIEAVGRTVEKYSSIKEYPVWGFGAKYAGKVRHIFQVGKKPTVAGWQGALDAYRTVFESDLIMSGPTEINSVLNAAAVRSKQHYSASTSVAGMRYCILLILTDGIVHNLQSTRELVRKYRELQLPLSVVVVGIGRADFTEFHAWNRAPPEARGRFRFVEFRQHQYEPEELSREALLNVPHETVDYFLARNVLPR